MIGGFGITIGSSQNFVGGIMDSHKAIPDDYALRLG
jgi:hypothetical protein